MKVLAYFCDCIGPHTTDCQFYKRLKIKYSIPYGRFMKNPEKYEKWVDKQMEKK